MCATMSCKGSIIKLELCTVYKVGTDVLSFYKHVGSIMKKKNENIDDIILDEIRNRVFEESETNKIEQERQENEKINLEILQEMTHLPMKRVKEIAREVKSKYRGKKKQRKKKRKGRHTFPAGKILLSLFFVIAAGLLTIFVINGVQGYRKKRAIETYQELVMKYGELLTATAGGNLDMVKYLIENGAPVDVDGYKNDTALMIAVKKQYVDIINFLLEAGADVTKKEKNGKTALDYADEGSNRAIQRIIGSAFAEAVPRESPIRTLWKQGHSYSQTTFLACVKEKNTAALELFIQADEGAYSNDWDLRGVKEAAKNGDRDVLALLLDKGKNIDAHTINLALLWATKAGKTNSIDVLLKHDADINFHLTAYPAYSDDNYTPLMKALLANNDAVAYLLEQGADPNQMGGHPEITPLMVSLVYGRHMTLNRKHVEHIKLLITYGADVNKKSADNRTALSHARSIYGNIGKEIIKALEDAGAE
jgi:ankyrin repeat protein